MCIIWRNWSSLIWKCLCPSFIGSKIRITHIHTQTHILTWLCIQIYKFTGTITFHKIMKMKFFLSFSFCRIVCKNVIKRKHFNENLSICSLSFTLGNSGSVICSLCTCILPLNVIPLSPMKNLLQPLDVNVPNKNFGLTYLN